MSTPGDTDPILGTYRQRVSEARAWTFDAAAYGTPTSVSIEARDITADATAAGTLSNDLLASTSITPSGTVITTPLFTPTTAGRAYRLIITFTAGGETRRPAIIVHTVN